MHIEKHRLPKGMSYPLKSSVLESVLTTAGITIDTQLIIAPSEIFFDALYWLPNPNVPYERLYVRAGAVQAADAYAARRYIEDAVMPELITWITQILKYPLNSPLRQHNLYFRKEWPPKD